MELTEKQKEQMETAFKKSYPFLDLNADMRNGERLEGFRYGYTAAVNRECAWKMDNDDPAMPGRWTGDCGVEWWFEESGVTDDHQNFCPNCGGKVVEVKNDTTN